MFDYKKMGRPRTEEERKERHAREHPGTPLPSRGAGGGTGRLARGLQPRTTKERTSRHSQKYGTERLPERGSGLGGGLGTGRGILDMSPEELIFGKRTKSG